MNSDSSPQVDSQIREKFAKLASNPESRSFLSETLWRLHHDEVAQCQHLEIQSTLIICTVLIVATANLALIFHDQLVDIYDFPYAILLCISGLLGGMISVRNAIRSEVRLTRAQVYQSLLDDLLLEGIIGDIQASVNKTATAEFADLTVKTLQLRPPLQKIRVEWSWVAVQFLLFSSGAMIAVFIACS